MRSGTEGITGPEKREHSIKLNSTRRRRASVLFAADDREPRSNERLLLDGADLVVAADARVTDGCGHM